MVTIIDHHHHILPHPHPDDHHGNCEKTNVHCCLMLLPPLARPLLASIMEQGVLHSTTIQTNPIKQGVLHSTTIQTNTTLFYILQWLVTYISSYFFRRHAYNGARVTALNYYTNQSNKAT